MKDLPPSDQPRLVMDRRIPAMDGVRGVASLSILVYHYVFSLNPALPAVPLLQKATSSLWSAVDLFFVLSGFLICGVLVNKPKTAATWRGFMVRRACRIVPLYAILLILYVLFAEHLKGTWDQDMKVSPVPLWSFFVFLQNFFVSVQHFGPSWLGVTWSLALEEQFYLLLPPLVFLLRRDRLLPAFLTLVLMAPLFRIIPVFLYDHVMLPSRCDSFFLGAALAVLVRDTGILDWLAKHRVFLVMWITLLWLGMAVFTLYPKVLGRVSYTWIAASYVSILCFLLARPQSILSHVLSIKPVRFLGDISFGIYLFHSPILAVTSLVLRPGGNSIDSDPIKNTSFLMVGVATVVTLVVASVLHALVEKPVISLSRQVKF